MLWGLKFDLCSGFLSAKEINEKCSHPRAAVGLAYSTAEKLCTEHQHWEKVIVKCGLGGGPAVLLETMLMLYSQGCLHEVPPSTPGVVELPKSAARV